MISIIDYDAGNIKSVENILKHFSAGYSLTKDAKILLSSDGVILPGVGSFGAAAASLKKSGLGEIIKECALRRIPILGICLGLQMLFEGSEESGGVQGLALISGRVSKIQCGERKLPHIGWTSLENIDGTLLGGVEKNDYFYFVHSYGAHAEENCTRAKARYGEEFDAYVEKDRIFGCQFHPEKSSGAGLKVMANFLAYCEEVKGK